MEAPPDNVEVFCKVCPAEKAMCLQGTMIGPDKGFWRQDGKSDNFLKCFEDEVACKGLFFDYDPINET